MENNQKKGILGRLKNKMAKTGDTLVNKVDKVLSGEMTIEDGMIDEIEEILVTADIGVKTSYKLLEALNARIMRKEVRNPLALKKSLKEDMSNILLSQEKRLDIDIDKPFVIMVVGVNGAGKTTTVGKLAHQYKSYGKGVMIAAGDTFRAAAIEQLEVWGERSGIPVIKHHDGADPGSVAFDAITAAKARGADVLIIDTAGRLHTKANLMEELKKVKRVISKVNPDAPHEILLVLDASTGQNAISQAKIFNEAVGVTGLAVTKLDGTPKGGVVIGIADELKIPIRFIGVGEGRNDLKEFSAIEFIDAIF